MWQTTRLFLNDFENAFQEVDKLLNNLTESNLGIPVDWAERDQSNYYLSIPAAGCKKEDVDISVKGKVITIKLKPSHKKFGDQKSYYFNAGHMIENLVIEAKLNDGVLDIKIPTPEASGSTEATKVPVT